MMVYLNGLTLGLSLVSALGPQNAFLIRQGALRNHAVLSALICFVCDFILVWASITGLHQALKAHPALQTWLTWFGVSFLLYYGAAALRRGFMAHKQADIGQQTITNRLQIIALALGFSLLNPHAIIDSLIIIGSGSTQFPDHQYAFLLGVISASFLWLSSLICTTHYFSDFLSKQSVWCRIEKLSGALMIGLGLKLALSQLYWG